MAELIKEANHLIASSADEDVAKYVGEDAMGDRVQEWLETPEGTMANHPSWGHNLTQFKHDPLSPDLAILMELAIVAKLPRDIPDIILLGIDVTNLDIDLCRVVIRHQFGYSATNVNL